MTKIAVVIPYRDRLEDLKNLEDPLKKSLEGLDYEIIVSEQSDSKPFNRGLANNVGMKFALQQGATHVITHDVDSIPLSVNYSPCRHVARLCGIFNGRCTPNGNGGPYLGGIVMLSAEAIHATNGYPNKIFGWGHEDDLLRERAWAKKLEIQYRCGFYVVRDHPRDMSFYWKNGAFIAENRPNLGGISTVEKSATFNSYREKFGTFVRFVCI